ncbi:1-acyl-sn-glycerol-3-phosphate acyltransferase [Bdellovibrio sp. qaytius]|nr:1-acyl-sn-glycerol-3-phosphate acyltransferase [Bdellovibrio sp. qaytius]
MKLVLKVILQLRAVVTTCLFIIATAFLSALGVTMNILFNRRRLDNWIMTTWGNLSCKIFNVELKTYGAENLKRGQGAVLLFNHASFMDILAICGALYNVRFGAKIELFKIPVFGACMRRFGTLPISRGNREEVFKVYEEAKIRFARGERFALSPEGGRFHAEQLLPFKAGPFVFGINSQVPLIPVVIKGAYEVWPKGKMLANSDRWKRTIEVHVLEPVSTEGFTTKDRTVLQDKIYKAMNAVYIAPMN